MKRIAVVIGNSRIFAATMRYLSSKWSPSLVASEPSSDAVLITDDPKLAASHECSVLVDSIESVECCVERALALARGKEGYDELVIGVDTGPRLAYIALCDGTIVEYAHGLSLGALITRIKRAIEVYPARTVRIRVGDKAQGGEVAETIKLALSEKRVVVEVVDEQGTSTRRTNNAKLPRDVVAAMNIAFRCRR